MRDLNVVIAGAAGERIQTVGAMLPETVLATSREASLLILDKDVSNKHHFYTNRLDK